ncbi:MAG: glycosyltransferase family 2 protein [Pyrinomonadaceae bacterium]
MKKPLISVIIPNYNYAKYIAKTVQSALDQTYPCVEVIVVDDESKDDSLAVLDQFSGRIEVVAQANQGVSAARNNGVAASSGEFVAFLDADDLWSPEKLERQMAVIDADREVGLVHCWMTYIDPQDRPMGQMADGTEGWIANDIMRFDGGGVIGAGSTSLIPRSVFDEVGGFDTRMSTAADWDISYRIAARHKIGIVNAPLVQYRIHNSNMHGNVAAMEHDMVLAMKNAFAAGAKRNGGVGFGNVYKTLAGSYFRSGKFGSFVRTAALGLYYKPSNLSYFAAFPFRRLRRSQGDRQAK